MRLEALHNKRIGRREFLKLALAGLAVAGCGNEPVPRQTPDPFITATPLTPIIKEVTATPKPDTPTPVVIIKVITNTPEAKTPTPVATATPEPTPLFIISTPAPNAQRIETPLADIQTELEPLRPSFPIPPMGNDPDTTGQIIIEGDLVVNGFRIYDKDTDKRNFHISKTGAILIVEEGGAAVFAEWGGQVDYPQWNNRNEYIKKQIAPRMLENGCERGCQQIDVWSVRGKNQPQHIEVITRR